MNNSTQIDRKSSTIADGINVNRTTKYNDSPNKSLDYDLYYGQNVETSINDNQAMLDDRLNFEGAMSSDTVEEISDLGERTGNINNKASLDDTKLNLITQTQTGDDEVPPLARIQDVEDVNPNLPIPPVLTQDEINNLNQSMSDWNEYLKQNQTAMSVTQWVNLFDPMNTK